MKGSMYLGMFPHWNGDLGGEPHWSLIVNIEKSLLTTWGTTSSLHPAHL